jgi:hypothetical protein
MWVSMILSDHRQAERVLHHFSTYSAVRFWHLA